MFARTWCVLGMMLAGCSADEAPTTSYTEQAATVLIAPSSYDFGSLPIGVNSTYVAFNVVNTGTKTATVTRALSDTANYNIGSGCTAPLAPRASCNVTVRFHPVSSGQKTAALNVFLSTGGGAQAQLTGRGLAPATLAINPATYDFGAVPVNSTSAPVAISISNTGDSPTGTLTSSLSGAGFSISGNNCPAQLGSGQSCTVSVVFMTTSTNTKTGKLTVKASPGGTVTSALSGSGAVSGALAITPTSRDFGVIGAGSTSAASSFLVSNTGTGSTGVPTVALGGTDATAFVIAANGCTAALAPSATCTIGVRFAPSAGGSKTASLTVSAPQGGTATSTLTGTATVPTAVNDSFTVNEDSANVALAVLANDTNVGTGSIASVTQGANGTVAITGAGTGITYTPAANFFGTDSFTYTLSPGGSVGTVTVTVSPVDDPPVATDDSLSTAEDGVADGNLLANDVDIDGGPISIASFTQPSHGAVTMIGGFAEYTPQPDFFGPDSFTYTLAGGSTATVAVSVFSVNDAPSFAAGPDEDVYEGADVLKSDWATAISAGPSNESSQALTFLVENDNPGLFAVQPSISPSGALSYAIKADENGVAHLTVALRDDGGSGLNGVDTSPSQTFTIIAAPVNDAPSFVAGADVSLTQTTDPYSAQWATQISPGPSNESGQQVTFVVDNDNPAMFSAPPALSTAGVLTFTAATTGTATVTVTLRDDGGTAGGGIDTYGPITFAITVGGTRYAVGANLRNAAAGDFNQDGVVDLATPDGASSVVRVLLGSASGGLAEAGSYYAGRVPVWVVTADFDRDGRLDLAASNSDGGASSLNVFLGHGDGTFAPALSTDIGVNPFGMAIGDINGDGSPDLAVAFQTGLLGILLGNGDGTFSTNVIAVAAQSLTVAVADLDSDGALDIVTADYQSGRIWLLRGHGDGSFEEPSPSWVVNAPFAIDVADFDRDSRPDVAIAGADGVTVLRGAPSFLLYGPALPSTTFGHNAHGVAAFDANSDGILDLAVSYLDDNKVTLFTGIGDGSFHAVNTTQVTAPYSLTAADFDRDGAADLAVPTFGPEGAITIIRSRAPSRRSLGGPTTYSLGSNPRNLAFGDFNRDGFVDVAVPEGDSSTVSVKLGSATGFGASVSYYGGRVPVFVATADFNHDGRLDLAAISSDGPASTFTMLLGSGDGSFVPQPSTDIGVNPFNMAVGDMNRDGSPDLAVAFQNGSLGILLGNGDGTFVTTVTPVGSASLALALGDFNRDGVLDVAMPDLGANVIRILLGHGDGTFAPATNHAVGSQPYAVAVSDFNRDGRSDLAVTNSGSGTVSVLLGGGDGTFQEVETVDTGAGATGHPQHVVAVDLDRDGIVDLAVANFDGNSIAVLHGNSDGTFQTAITSDVPTPFSVASADIDRDGAFDLAATTFGAAGVMSIFRSAAPLLATGSSHTCAVVGGTARCWGYNGSGQLGTNTTTSSLVPVPVVGLPSGATAITAAQDHTCAVVNGKAWCWGSNEHGQLGTGSTTSSLVPVPVAGLSSGVTAIAAGLSGYTCAIVNGGVKCWGYNGQGELGNGSTADSYAPVDVVGLGSGITTISAGAFHSCAVTFGGEAWCWGLNQAGQLGPNAPSYSATPVQAYSGVTQIAAGYSHTCALSRQGAFWRNTAFCWGNNDNGQLGNNTTISSATPVMVDGIYEATALTAGRTHTCAMVAGAARCWGGNDDGQLGNNSTTSTTTPVFASGLTIGLESVAAGRAHTCAVADGGLYCWGTGPLGTGSTAGSLVPVPVN